MQALEGLVNLGLNFVLEYEKGVTLMMGGIKGTALECDSYRAFAHSLILLVN